MSYSRNSYSGLASATPDNRASVKRQRRGTTGTARVAQRVRHPKLPLRETLALVRVIATGQATIGDLKRTARMSRATIYRLLSCCERDLGMRIDCESRVFKLRDWGVLNRRRLMKP